MTHHKGMRQTHLGLAKAINTAKSPPAGLPKGTMAAGLLMGVVQSVQIGPPPSATVTLAGSSTSVAGLRFFSRASPVAGETVYLAQIGTDLVIVDKLATAMAATVESGRYLGAWPGPPGFSGISSGAFAWASGPSPQQGDWGIDYYGGVWTYADSTRGWIRSAGGLWMAMANSGSNVLTPSTTQWINFATQIDPLGLLINSGTVNFRLQIPTFTGAGAPKVFGLGQLWRVHGSVSYGGANADVRSQITLQTGTGFGGHIDQSAIGGDRSGHFSEVINILASVTTQVGVQIIANGGANNVSVVADGRYTYVTFEYVGSE